MMTLISQILRFGISIGSKGGVAGKVKVDLISPLTETTLSPRTCGSFKPAQRFSADIGSGEEVVVVKMAPMICQRTHDFKGLIVI